MNNQLLLIFDPYFKPNSKIYCILNLYWILFLIKINDQMSFCISSYRNIRLMALYIIKAEHLRFDTIHGKSIVRRSCARANERARSSCILIICVPFVRVVSDFRVNYFVYHKSIGVEMTFVQSLRWKSYLWKGSQSQPSIWCRRFQTNLPGQCSWTHS